ncbi:hypothetical protein PYR74_07905 [Acinetobacter bereziniae]|jgi:hypothetical protein|uniref:hypothetical protein n=1 Tax=Acinetobacter TaxID=469 RepID=UPI00158069DF|nr:MULTISPECIES: hypothetical protein [Acinetobacter]MCM8510787.1 hypothetical protein [Acinetobacter bereziniae]MDR3027460.1 hypothetical protein [Acinetobacter sp.]NUF61755.1 hypothetical protein [Acinetobacter bereziniae]NUG06464.1 hypothetical protein [Acinetobacter bereziniae]NUG63046.1 hypothetical protein [Acinetobacter bereziniae]
MQKIFSKSVMVFMCIGALIGTTQTWAHGDEHKTADGKTTVKKQEKCKEPCKPTKESKTQKNDHSQHQHGTSTDMSKMDHSKMSNKTSK